MTTLSTKIVTSSRFGFGMIDHSKRPIYALKARKRSSMSRTDFFTAIRSCGLSNFHPYGLLSQPFGQLAQHLERDYGRFRERVCRSVFLLKLGVFTSEG